MGKPGGARKALGLGGLALLAVAITASAEDVVPKPSIANPVDYFAWINNRWELPENQNAADLYYKAIEAVAIPEPDQIPIPGEWTAEQRNEVDRLIAANDRALDLLRQASSRPSCFFRLVTDGHSEEHLKWGQDRRHVTVRHLCKTLALRAFGLAANGRPRESAEDLCTIVRVAEHFFDQPSLVDYLIGLGCAEMAYEQIGITAQRITSADDLALLLAALEKADRRPLPPPARALDGELAKTHEYLQRFLKDANQDGLCDAWAIPGAGVTPLTAPISFDAAVERTSAIAERWKTVLLEPLLPRAMLDSDTLVREMDADKTGVLEFGFPRLGHLMVMRGRVLARQSGAYVVPALHAFKLKHSRWPKDLAELKQIRPSLPLSDVFKPTEDLRYRLDDSGPLLYSVGQNARDDGGRSDDRRTGDIVLWPPSGRREASEKRE